MTIAVNVRIPAPRPSVRTRTAPSMDEVVSAVVAFLAVDGRAQRWLDAPRPCPCTRTGDECLRCYAVTVLARQAIAGGAT